MMRFDDKYFLAEQIKLHRKKLGITQAELAEKVDLSTQHISRIEGACYVPSLKSFFLIAEVLNMDLRIFGFGTSKTQNQKKDVLIQKIINATDAELIFYQNMIESVSVSLSTIRTKLL